MVEDQNARWRWIGRCQSGFQARVDIFADGGDVGNSKRARTIATSEVQGKQSRMLGLGFPKLFDVRPFGCWFLNFEVVLNQQQLRAVDANTFPVGGRNTNDANRFGRTKTSQQNGLATHLSKRGNSLIVRPKLRDLLLVVKQRFGKRAGVVFGVRGLLNGDQKHFARVGLQKFREGSLQLAEVLLLVHDAVVQFESVVSMAATNVKKTDPCFELLSDRKALTFRGP